MVRVTRNSDYLAHKGVKGMKWGYNDGQRNGKRTKSELEKLQEVRNELKKGKTAGSGDIEKDYEEANNMLKYLGISLDLHSDDKAVAKTMTIYETMRNSKDNYDSQYDWLSAFSKKLKAIGYDMTACDEYLAENKDKLNEIKTGAGSGEKPTKEKASKGSKKSSSSEKEPKEKKTSSKETKAKSEKKKKEESNAEKMKKHHIKNSSKLKQRSERTSITSNKKASNLMKFSHSYSVERSDDELYHHGILGQRWGIRRYQNSDGTLTPEGRERYNGSSQSSRFGVAKGKNNSVKKYSRSRASKMTDAELDAATQRLNRETNYRIASNNHSKTKERTDQIQNAVLLTGAFVALGANADKIYKAAKMGQRLVKKKFNL